MIDKKESIRRLTVLRDFLKDNVNDGDFRMDEWECGTAKCALGWACCISDFNDLGLLWKVEEGKSSCPNFYVYDGYEAGAKFFGISNSQSFFIFDPSRYEGVCPDWWVTKVALPITMQDVLNHIDDVIKEQEA